METKNNITQEQFETIEGYLNNSMNAAELKNFETKLETDSQLRERVAHVRQLILGIESAALKNQLDNFHEEMIPVRNLNNEDALKRKSLASRIFTISIAASIILVLGIFLFMNQGSTSEKLFAKHFTPDPGLPTTMSTSDNFDFYDAMVDYKRAEYATAIQKWEQLSTQNPGNDTLNYFLGVSYLAEGNTNKASEYLIRTMENSNSTFKEDAYFYAALTEIRRDNIPGAKQLLSKSTSEKSKNLLLELSD